MGILYSVMMYGLAMLLVVLCGCLFVLFNVATFLVIGAMLLVPILVCAVDFFHALKPTPADATVQSS